MCRSKSRRKTGIAVLFSALTLLTQAHTEQLATDTVLTVTEARLDKNGDFIPDLLGKRITVGGRANVYSGVIHTDRLVVFLEDDQSGIGLYNTEFGAPIAEGDSVIATGYVDQFEGLTRLTQVTYRRVFIYSAMPPYPHVRISQANNERYEGRVIRAEGEITRKWEDAYGTYLTLRENSASRDSVTAFLLFRHKPGLTFKDVEIGDHFRITGVMIQFARGQALNTGYELLPRYPEDLVRLDTPARTYALILSICLGILALSLVWIWMLRRQVTRQTKQLRESEARFRSIFEGARDGMIVLGDDLVIEDANPAACDLYRMTREELLNRSFAELFGQQPSPAPTLQPAIDPANAVHEFEATLSRGGRVTIYLLAKMNSVEIGSTHKVVLVLRDITERRRGELERQVMHRIAEGVATSASLDELLKLTHEALRTVLYAENSCVALYDQTTGLFSFPYFVDQRDSAPQPEAMPKSCIAHVFHTGEPALITPMAIKQRRDLNQIEFVGSPALSWIGVPIQTPARTIGVLALQHHELEDVYSERDLKFLTSVGNQLAVVLELVRANARIRDSETKLNVILESTADGILAVDNKGNVLRTNKRFAELWRIPESLIDSKDDARLLDHVLAQLVDPQGFLAKVRSLYGSTDEDRDIIYFTDGRVFERFSAAIMMGEDNVGRVWSFRDITERRHAEDALQKSEARYRHLFQGSRDAIVTVEPPMWRFTSGNPAAVELFGAKDETEFLLYEPWRLSPMYQSDGRASEEKAKEMIEKAMLGGSHFFEWTHKRISGELFPATVLLSRVEQDENVFLQATVRDITERKRAEEALLESELRFATAFQKSPIAMMISSVTTGEYIEANEAFFRESGYPRNEIIGQTSAKLGIFFDPDDRERLLAQVRKEGSVRSMQIQFRLKTGELRKCLISIQVIKLNGEPHLLSTIIDITDRERAEEALRYTQKMESIGVLAGGIAHDFNNLLNAMLGQSTLAMGKLPKENEARTHIEKSIKAAERASDLTKQLLAYSGKGRFAVTEIDLNNLVTANAELLRATVAKTVQVRFELGIPSSIIHGDVSQIQQVIMNLVMNAGEAIEPNPGFITVRTAQIEISAGSSEYSKYVNAPLPPGWYASLQVSDTGQGMKPEVLTRIFDPFFTTKFTGRGLGLAAVLGVIRGHKGGLRIESAEGKGSQFEIVFPLVSSSIAPEMIEEKEPASIAGEGRTILVIDDEPSVLELLQDIFTGAAFEFIGALSPIEGIELYRQKQQNIAMVVLDYSMPEMNGKDAFEKLAQVNKDVKVLLCSGYSEEETVSTFGELRPAGFIHKPYQPSALLERIARVLS